MSKDDEKLVGCLLSGILTFGAAPFIAALKGFTLATMWRWFIVPQFNAPTLGTLSAIGLFLTADLLFHRYSKSETHEENMLGDTVSRILFIVIACALTLVEGWIVLKLMGR